MRKAIILAMTTAALLGLPVAVAADTTFPAIGGSGDAQHEDRCPPGQWLVGLKGRAGLWIDQIQIICAAIRPDGTHAATWYGPARGGGGGAPQEFSCNDNSVVYGVHAWLSAYGRQVKYIDVRCGSMNSDSQTGFRFNTEGAPMGVTYGQGPHEQTCPNGELAVGFNIHYGKDVNAMGLLCGHR